MPAQLSASLEFVLENFDRDFQLAEMSEAGGLSQWALTRMFQKSFGVSPMRWVWRFRTNLGRECIQLVPDWQLTDISVLCGFSSLAHFSRMFKREFGVAPSDFRQEYAQLLGGAAICRAIQFADLARDYRPLLKEVLAATLQTAQKTG
jgi:transcriptional regulator GlxA family with amidase domain